MLAIGTHILTYAQEEWVEETVVAAQEAQPFGMIAISARGKPVVLDWDFGNEARIGERSAAGCWEFTMAPFGNFGDFTVEGDGDWTLAYVDDAVTVAHWEGEQWSTRVIDDERTSSTFAGRLHLTLDPQGRASFSYIRSGMVRLAWRDFFGGWQEEEVATVQIAHQHSAAAYTSNGQVHIVYADLTTSYHAMKEGGQWQVTPLPMSLHGTHPSIVIDANDRVHMAMVVRGGLAYGLFSDGQWSVQELFQEAHESGAVQPWPTNLSLTSDGHPVVTFHRQGGTSGSSYWLGQWTGETWTARPVVEDLSFGGDHGDLALDDDDRPHLVYSVGHLPPNGGTIVYGLRYASLEPIPLTWESWLAHQRAEHPQAPDESFAPEADPDGDGCNQFCEYAFDTLPFMPGPVTWGAALETGLDIHLPRDRQDLWYHLEASEDLEDWNRVASITGTGEILDDPGDQVGYECQRDRYTLRLENRTARYVVRVRVERVEDQF